MLLLLLLLLLLHGSGFDDIQRVGGGVRGAIFLTFLNSVFGLGGMVFRPTNPRRRIVGDAVTVSVLWRGGDCEGASLAVLAV